MENSIDYINKAGHVDMTVKASSLNPVISTDYYTEDPTDIGHQVKRNDVEPAVQMLQRGFIVTSQDGGPVDASEVVEGISDLNILQNDLNELFKATGGLFYGKKVYVKEMKKYYYYSHASDASSEGDDVWKPIE